MIGAAGAVRDHGPSEFSGRHDHGSVPNRLHGFGEPGEPRSEAFKFACESARPCPLIGVRVVPSRIEYGDTRSGGTHEKLADGRDHRFDVTGVAFALPGR